MNPLPRSFYGQDTPAVARALLGQWLFHRTPEGLAGGRIVETEAYVRDDPANHATRGKTRRNAAMFGPPGYAYVYAIHNHYCLNAVTGPEGVGEAVLIRALEPVEGLDLMRARRGRAALRDLTNGPGKLCQALAITRAQNEMDLTDSDLFVAEGERVDPEQVVTTVRVGIRLAADWPLRFYVAGSEFVSKR